MPYHTYRYTRVPKKSSNNSIAKVKHGKAFYRGMRQKDIGAREPCKGNISENKVSIVNGPSTSSSQQEKLRRRHAADSTISYNTTKSKKEKSLSPATYGNFFAAAVAWV